MTDLAFERSRWRAEVTGPRRRAAGFTLTELLVVLAISMVITAMGFPQLTAGVRRHRLQASATMIAGKLTEARINALKRNRPTWLAINTAARTVQVQMADPSGTSDIGPPGFLSEGITFGETPAQVAYDAMGRTTAVQTIQVRAGTQLRTVTVRLTGAATVN